MYLSTVFSMYLLKQSLLRNNQAYSLNNFSIGTIYGGTFMYLSIPILKLKITFENDQVKAALNITRGGLQDMRAWG